MLPLEGFPARYSDQNADRKFFKGKGACEVLLTNQVYRTGTRLKPNKHSKKSNPVFIGKYGAFYGDYHLYEQAFASPYIRTRSGKEIKMRPIRHVPNERGYIMFYDHAIAR